MSVMHITKTNYDELVKNSDKPVLLDFWAPWCGPCRMVGPIVEEIAQEREDIAVGKINVDEEVELAMEFGVASIPTLVVVEHGEVMNKAIGYRRRSRNCWADMADPIGTFRRRLKAPPEFFTFCAGNSTA